MLSLIIFLCAIVVNTNSHKLLLPETPSNSLETSSDSKITINSSHEIQNNNEETTKIQAEGDSTHEILKNITAADSLEQLQRSEEHVISIETGFHTPTNIFNGDRCPTGFVKVEGQCVEEH